MNWGTILASSAAKMPGLACLPGRLEFDAVLMFRSAVRAAAAAAFAVGALTVLEGGAVAQSGQPIKIGFSMAMTGGLAANGKSGLLAQKIWEEDVNAKGGLLGRPVRLIYYDDQSNPSTVPGIYAKLLDIDKVDLVIGAYATAQIAPAMPIVIQRKRVFISLLGLAVNSDFKYPNYFSMIPNGPDSKVSVTKGFFDTAMAQSPTPQSVAIVAADQEFSRNAADGARENAEKAASRSCTIRPIRRRPPISARWCAPSLPQIRISWSSVPIRPTRSAW